MCEFNFEEQELGNIFLEVKENPEIALFLTETAYIAFSSGRAADLTEPFPSFLLRGQELRPKAGNLDHIKRAQEAGTDVKQAAKVSTNNKNCDKGSDFIKVIYNVINKIQTIETRTEFRQRITDCAAVYLQTKKLY